MVNGSIEVETLNVVFLKCLFLKEDINFFQEYFPMQHIEDIERIFLAMKNE